MKVDLERFAGFPLLFDPETLELETDGSITFAITSRKAHELHAVLLTPDAVAPDTELYWMHAVAEAPPAARQALGRYDLTFSLVLLPSLRIGREFVKTAGHYHPPIPGTPYGFPEVYTQLHGRLLLFLQKRDPSNPDVLADCALVEMTPGYIITLPPGYAHVLINPTDEPALMAGLYGKVFEPNYVPVRERKGLAYYVVADNKGMAIEPNPLYPEAPSLRRLTELAGTPFEPPEPGVAVWQSFLNNPEMYAFLTRPEAVVERFGTPHLE